MTQPFTYNFRVRYAEVDPQAVVFNSRYLEYADILVTEYLRERRAHGMAPDLEFHVRRAEVDYLRPIRNDELVEGRLTVERIGTSSMTMLVSLHGADDGVHRADIRLVQVQVDLASGLPERISDETRAAFGFPALEKADG
ncbi:MAG: acyl-CoA thioesterase [Alphaproteobacteria bacterium]|nr:MAG: acyl-CoA thioesterase [Alphaproteobacteria bacterium]